jgi:tetratricopeptide (TPR) repeat protein
MDAPTPECRRLRQDVEYALRRALDPADVLPLLHRLARAAAPGSEESLFAHRHLAELLVERHPWRAALYARRVLAAREDDDRVLAVLALCQTLLGNYRYAVKSYMRALDASPNNPWYAHNLGHLLDVALNRPSEAVPWLRAAYAQASWSDEVRLSLSHALARVGRVAEARRVLVRGMKKTPSREQEALLRWLDEGATETGDRSSRAALAPPRIPRIARKPARRARPNRAESIDALDDALVQGLEHLPLDVHQRARARALARDAGPAIAEDSAGLSARGRSGPPSPESLAAAIAYAIVYVDHVPLTQAEVAATFRVSVASVRVGFSALRARLDLTRGDERYATPRRG